MALLASCGGSIAADAKTYGPGAPGIDEALADLDAGEAEIAARFGSPMGRPQQAYPQQGYGQPGAYPQVQPAPQPVPSEEPKPPHAQPPADAPVQPSAPPPAAPASGDAEALESEADDRCEIACRALGSMKRAADHVCRAAGSTDERCSRARERVTAASARVAESCEDCAG